MWGARENFFRKASRDPWIQKWDAWGVLMDSFPEHLRSGYEPRNWEGLARAQARFIWAEASSGDPSFYLLPPLPLIFFSLIENHNLGILVLENTSTHSRSWRRLLENSFQQEVVSVIQQVHCKVRGPSTEAHPNPTSLLNFNYPRDTWFLRKKQHL